MWFPWTIGPFLSISSSVDWQEEVWSSLVGLDAPGTSGDTALSREWPREGSPQCIVRRSSSALKARFARLRPARPSEMTPFDTPMRQAFEGHLKQGVWAFFPTYSQVTSNCSWALSLFGLNLVPIGERPLGPRRLQCRCRGARRPGAGTTGDTLPSSYAHAPAEEGGVGRKKTGKRWTATIPERPGR